MKIQYVPPLSETITLCAEGMLMAQSRHNGSQTGVSAGVPRKQDMWENGEDTVRNVWRD